ncbi:MAG: hypothetical protein OEY30_00240 [Candidatus Bathyarchaeota archaeon]|nr:hypothetical protein [Candidatus Bathyarchaeota archaeon]
MIATEAELLREQMKVIAAKMERRARILEKLEGISPETRKMVQDELDRVAKLVYARERPRIPDLNFRDINILLKHLLTISV